MGKRKSGEPRSPKKAFRLKEEEIYRLFKNGGNQLGLDLNSDQVNQLSTYVVELIRWNQKINLTGLKSTRDIIIKNFLDSLTPLSFFNLKTKNFSKWLDIGTGAGFPGLAIKIVQPDKHMTLVEPNQKKTSFLHHMIGLLKLTDIQVINTRFEHLAPQAEKADLLMTRALSPSAIFSLASSHIRTGGKLLFFQSRYEKKTWDLFEKKHPYVKHERFISFHLPLIQDPRTLILFEIVGQTHKIPN